MFDLETCIGEHQLFVGDAGHSKPATDHVALENTKHVFVTSILNQSSVTDAIVRTDDADVSEVGSRRRRYIDRCLVGKQTIVRRANYHVACSRIADERSRDRSRNLL